ncbi:hypothetical protein [Frankia sp. CiP1_Cm_nod2]|uniref:hypothetical protein n=1 Tax=Frankia sp. CiP1_Cm_nod2 TaxID=2897161 RepID=UPI00202416CD
MSLRLSDILDADDDLASRATYRLLEPALRRRVRGIVRRAVPASCSCRDGRTCDTCRTIIDDLVLDAHRKLREAARGRLPRTRATGGGPGEEVREWRLLVDGLTAPAETAALDADTAGSMLAAAGTLRDSPSRPYRRTSPSDQAWLRAAVAQLVLYPTRNLDVELRRRAAVKRGLPARPMRGLDSSPAAGPLADDPPADCALRELVTGLWADVAHPYDLPATGRRHGLSPDAARVALHRGLDLLRAHDPARYRALVAGPLAARAADGTRSRPGAAFRPGAASWAEAARTPADGPSETGRETEHARSALLTKITSDVAPEHPDAVAALAPTTVTAPPCRTRSGTGSRRRQRDHLVTLRLLHTLLDAADGRAVDPVGRCRRLRGVDEPAAREEIRHLTMLVAAAGVMWVDKLVRQAENDQPPENGQPPA